MAPHRHSWDKKQTDTKAVLALFLGATSFVFGPLTGIPAIILGSVARRDIDQSGGRSGGALLARGGTLAGFFGVGFFTVFVLWIGSAVITPADDNANADLTTTTTIHETREQPAAQPSERAHAKVSKAPAAPSTPHPRGDVEPFHSIR